MRVQKVADFGLDFDLKRCDLTRPKGIFTELVAFLLTFDVAGEVSYLASRNK